MLKWNHGVTVNKIQTDRNLQGTAFQQINYKEMRRHCRLKENYEIHQRKIVWILVPGLKNLRKYSWDRERRLYFLYWRIYCYSFFKDPYLMEIDAEIFLDEIIRMSVIDFKITQGKGKKAGIWYGRNAVSQVLLILKGDGHMGGYCTTFKVFAYVWNFHSINKWIKMVE